MTYVILNPSVMIAASVYFADMEGFIWAGFLVCGILAFCINFYAQPSRMAYQLMLTRDGTLTCKRWIIRLHAPSFIPVVQADDPDGRSLVPFEMLCIVCAVRRHMAMPNTFVN